jgi:hypothetical protein
MSLSFIYRILLLKINRVLSKSILIGLVLSLVFSSLFCLSFVKLLSPKIKVLSIYIPITLKVSLEVIINKQGLYKEVSIPSLS